MKKFERTVILGIMIVFATNALFGCTYKGYESEHPALYSESINSILGVNGFYDGISLADPFIDILETDDFGRVMYMYRESTISALCIAQKYDDDYVYYYPDFNFIRVTQQVGNDNKSATEIMNEYFTENDIENLKSHNDFYKKFDDDKCIKTAIITRKNSPELNNETIGRLEALCNQYAKDSGCNGEDSVYRYAEFCTYDNYGRMLYYVYGVHRDVYGEGISPDSTTRDFHFAIIFNPDFDLDQTNALLELFDVDNYQNDLKEFKYLHNWNQPLL